MRQSDYSRVQIVWVGVVLAVAILLLATSWASAAATRVTILAPGNETGVRESLSSSNVITIGVGASLSVIPQLGWPQANAVQLAVMQANAAGGINIAGTMYTLVLVSADDGCNAVQGAFATQALLDAGAVAVVGYTCSGSSNAAQAIHGAAGVPMISPSATDAALTEQGYTTTFRVITRDDSPPVSLAAYLRNRLMLEKAAIVQLDSFWGNWANDSFSAAFAELGGTVTSRRTVASTTEFATALAAIQAEDPDMIFYADTDPNHAGLLSSVAYSLGMGDTIIAWNTFTEDEAVLAVYAAQAGAAAEGDHVVMYYRRTRDMPGYAAFNAAYQAAGFPNFGNEATMLGAFAYDGANIIIAAIKRAQSTNPSDIRDAIASTTSYRGVVGTYEGFDAKGDVIPQWAWLERYSNGYWITLHPYSTFLPIMVRKSR